tara:strand:+ start:243 stop:506 length:264 start_codon:yes stop_codon:yes gene_type:complete
MGGFVRAIRRVFSKPKQVVVQQQAPVQTVTQTAKATDAKTSQAMAASKAGKYGTSTMMNEATGVEEEANISKTALGGTSIKKKKKYA